MRIDKLASDIIKQADTVEDFNKVLKLNLDDKVTTHGMQLIRILDSIETRSKDITVKNEIIDVKKKLSKAMELFQEVNEELFSMQQRIINEEELATK